MASIVQDKPFLESLYPSHKDSFQPIADLVAADVDIGNDEVTDVYQRVSKAQANYAISKIENVRAAKSEIVQELTGQADPFGASEAARTRYGNELALTKKLEGTSQKEVLDMAAAGATSPDVGATAFWYSNFSAVFKNAVEGGWRAEEMPDVYGERDSVATALKDAAARKQTDEQRVASKKLDAFNLEWQESGIEKTLQTAEHTIDRDGDLLVARLVEPRARTPREIQMADGRQRVREGQAKIETAVEEKAAFDALG
jgi:hypothetical protein